MRRIIIGVTTAVVLVVGYLVYTGGDEGYTVKAELPNAGGLRPNSSVKVAGVTGGTVEKLDITPRDTAIVTMKLDDSVGAVGKDATIKIRPTDLLGERYIELDVGNQDEPLADDGVLPKSRTDLPVELDDVLNTFDGDTRERVKILVNEFGVALGSRGKDLAALLDAMPASLTDARELVAEITSEDASLRRLLQRGDSLTAAVDGKKDELGELVAQADTTLKALADRRDKIGRTLDSAPGGLTELQRTLTQLRQASTNLRPAAVDLKNAAAPLTGTLNALPGFEDAARDSLKAAKKAAPALTKLGNDATEPLQALTPTLARLRETSETAAPTLDNLEQRGFEDIAYFIQNWSLSTKQRDGLGHLLGAVLAFEPDMIRSLTDTLFSAGPPADVNPDTPDPPDPDPEARKKSSPESSGSPAPAAKAPAASGSDPATTAAPERGLLGGLVDGVSGLLGGRTDGAKSDKPGSSPKGEGLPGLLNNLLAP